MVLDDRKPNLSLEVLRQGGFEEADISSVDVAEILAEIERGDAWELSVHPTEQFPQYPHLHLDWHRGFGLVVMAFEHEQSIGYYPIIGTDCGPPEVVIELGGQALEKWPRELFVPKDVAVQALQTFLRTGRQDLSFTWVANDAFEREVIWRDRAERSEWEKQQRK